MAESITITPRLIYLEDLATTTEPTGETASVNVFGATGNPQTLTKIAIVQLTDFHAAADDAGAAAAGVPVGGIYYNVTNGALQTRMS